MYINESFINLSLIVIRLIQYNLKVIFANKFVYFLSGAVFLFIAITALNLFYINTVFDEEVVYWILLLCGFLIIFYPVTFGIQNDADNRMLEIIFCIPNYRYKVHLFRVILIFSVTAAILFIFIILCHYLLTSILLFEMLSSVMVPVVFLGSAAFLITTFMKDGNTTAVIMILAMILLRSANDFFQNNPEWDLFLNPFSIPRNFNETVWAEIVLQNRIYLLTGSVIALLYGLLNLQKREKLL